MAILISSCNDASKKDMSDASQKIKEANTDMKEAIIVTNDSVKAAAVSNWKTFKNESDSAIVGMEREGTTLEEKIAKANSKEKGKLKEPYQLVLITGSLSLSPPISRSV